MIPTFEKSFASHPKSKFWSNKNKIEPNQIFKGCQQLPNYYTTLHKLKIH